MFTQSIFYHAQLSYEMCTKLLNIDFVNPQLQISDFCNLISLSKGSLKDHSDLSNLISTILWYL